MGDPEEHKDEELSVKADTPAPKEEGPSEPKEPEADPIRKGEGDQPEVE
jgi:hypothetical protein